MDRQPGRLLYQDASQTYRLFLCEPSSRRLTRSDVETLDPAELLAIILGGDRQLGTAAALLERFGSLLDLARADLPELYAVPGVGFALAGRLMAATELTRRLMLAEVGERPLVRSPADIAPLLMAEIGHKTQEHFVVLFLDTRNRLVGREVLYKGNLHQSQVRIAEVFRAAIQRNCATIILAHNHPSGDPTPSPQDVAMTREIEMVGQLLDIVLLDHIVVGPYQWVSINSLGAVAAGIE